MNGIPANEKQCNFTLNRIAFFIDIQSEAASDSLEPPFS